MSRADNVALMREVYDLLALVAKNVDWMPHPHCSQVDSAVRALEPKVLDMILDMTSGNFYKQVIQND